jgi:N utilization substance protein B
VYAWDIRQAAGGRRDLTRVANEVWDDLIVPADERRLAGALILLVAKHAGPIDRDLLAVTTNWRLERLGAIERSVLRLGCDAAACGDPGSRPARGALRIRAEREVRERRARRARPARRPLVIVARAPGGA